jgi:aminoglycoside 6'-N-acetyltransferase
LVLIDYQNLGIRLMRDDDDDVACMAKWLSNPRVLEFYEGRDQPQTIQSIRQNYTPRVLGEDGVTPCLLIISGTPIGYAQFYRIEEDAFGMDQFIGEPVLWNHGLGSAFVSLLLRYLFRTAGAHRVVLDPHTRNARAIRCYEKCGFRKVGLLPRHELHEGEYRDCWLMEATPESSGLVNG